MSEKNTKASVKLRRVLKEITVGDVLSASAKLPVCGEHKKIFIFFRFQQNRARQDY